MVFAGTGGHLQLVVSSVHCCIICALLCCLHVFTLNGGDMVARQMWVVVGQCVKFVGSIVGVVVVG